MIASYSPTQAVPGTDAPIQVRVKEPNRGTFYPFAPMPGGGERRNSPLELQVNAMLGNDLRLEKDLSRWFPVWGAPGL